MEGSVTPPRPAPLAGVKIIDISTSVAGPTATTYLADLGADVVKIERVGEGDDARAWGPPFVAGESAWFHAVNRSKRSLAMNLTHADGLSALHRLLAQADVFVLSMNPAKLPRLGLDPDSVMAAHPHLVYCAISAFGLTGPDAGLPGYDLMAQARSGLMSVTGEAGGHPQRVSTALSDVVAGISAACAVVAALRGKDRTGHGDVVDVSLLDADLALMAPRIASFLAGEPEPQPSGATDSVIAVYQRFDTADSPIVIGAGNDAIWRRLCVAIDLEEFGSRAEFATNEGRRRHRSEIIEAVGRRLSERPAADWLAILARHRIPAAPVQRLSNVVADRQVKHRDSVFPLEPCAGPRPEGAEEAAGIASLHGVAPPWRLASIESAGGSGRRRMGAPGCDSAEVLRRYGFQEHEIERLVSSGVVEVS